MSGKVIQNDEQYETARLAILKMAADLDDPLSGMTAAEREKKNMVYDRTVDLMTKYRRGGLVQQFPHLREIYQQIGYQWQELESEPIQSSVTEQQQEPQEQKEEKPSSRLSGWLDE
ncbi:hypothetical protein J23TS9_06520 [Paenibacillus sp. J23TS9]|uniref:hypothetical protein n=1 Tax=Paenibacillus sp. J23TS9 TaxID=2807193 RepID=UPI001B1E3AD2|nr:hypothetical protein [Paenibacillus sp. J23TS9]GIP25522.1 hypothetical protein J23TS9_06520 [Paenibacillus sp. J23TS9]